MFDSIDWAGMFTGDIPFMEVIVRGSITYLAIFILLRVLLRRQSGGNVGITDVLVIVLLADAAQNSMAGGYQSVTNGIILVATIIFWSFFLDWLSFHWKFFSRLTASPKLPIIHEGKMLRKNMRRELITEDELMAEMRKKGCENLNDVDRGYMETDGSITIILKKKDD